MRIEGIDASRIKSKLRLRLLSVSLPFPHSQDPTTRMSSLSRMFDSTSKRK